MTVKQQPLGSTTLPLSELRIDEKSNVRKIGRGAGADFIASIKALGIQMPLIVRKNGKGYVVTDGGKRFEAAQALVQSGDMQADAPIPVIVSTASDAEARELSLALNLVRSDMHPVDAFRAFQSLHADKEKPLDVDALSARFGVPTKIVRQRLALGALDDTILNAWRDGDIKEETAQAFTLCPSKKEQARVYAKIVKTSWNHRVDAEGVKEALKVNPNDVGKFLNTIGIEAYEARGGKVTRDLFGSDHTVSDEALVKQMIDETLATTCQRLIAEGWQWATSDIPQHTYEFGRIQGQLNPTAAEKQQIATLEAKADDETLDYQQNEAAQEELDNLKASILLRSYTAKQKAKAGCFVSVGHDGSLSIEYGRTLPEKIKIETTKIVDEKTGATVTQTSLGKKKVAKGKSAPKGPAKLSNALADRLAEHRRAAIKSALVDHPHGNDFAALLARLVAGMIRPASNYSSAPAEVMRAYDSIMKSIAPKVMNAALRKAFDAKGYFEGCGKSFCLAAITEAVNADEARKVSKNKKGEIAKFALTNVGKTRWLPKELRTSHYDGPKGKSAAKLATKAKAKKRSK